MNFSAMMAKVLRGLESFCGAYIDDVIIGSETFEQHLEHVATVLSRFREAGLTVKLSKGEFACAELEYLGHRVGRGVMSPREVKVKALMNAPRPTSKRELQKLLGLANYYNRYIAHYSDVVRPLTDMLSKQRKFVWSQEAECSFNMIK
jgi:Reverse transcriptase (RNA-dependent DNA polymerase)